MKKQLPQELIDKIMIEYLDNIKDLKKLQDICKEQKYKYACKKTIVKKYSLLLNEIKEALDENNKIININIYFNGIDDDYNDELISFMDGNKLNIYTIIKNINLFEEILENKGTQKLLNYKYLNNNNNTQRIIKYNNIDIKLKYILM